MLKIGFVGCGRISFKHFEALQKLKNRVKVVAVCDENPQSAENAANVFGCKYYANIGTMLQNESLDIVTLATPNGLRAEHAIACANANIDVLCEKPMSVSDDGAKLILEKFQETGRRFFLIHQNRYNSPIEFIKKAITDGSFGKIYMMTSNVFWQRPQEYYSKSAWHGTANMDGGAYMTQASHYVDMLNWFAASPVKEVYSSLATQARQIETEDTGSVIIKWHNGIIGNINLSILTYPKNYEGSITIIGEKGTAKIGGVALNTIEYCVFENQPENFDYNQFNYSTDSVYGFGHEQVYNRIVNFYETGDDSSLIGVEEAYSSFKILDAIIKSNKLKSPIIF